MAWLKSLAYAACVASACSTMAAWTTQAGETQNLEWIVGAASEAQAKGDFSTAADLYQRAVKLSPNTAELWANLGLVEHLAGNSSQAISSFREAAHLNRSLYVPQLFLGIENLKLNRAEAAIPFLQRAEQLNPKDPQVPLALGRAFALSGKGDRSSDAYVRAVDLTPSDANAWLGLGKAELQQSSADDRLLTDAHKGSQYTTLRAAERYAEQGKLIQASNTYKSALAAKPLPPLCAHAGYGMVLMRQQEIAGASSEFDRELKLNPACSLAKLGLVAIRLQQADRDSALKDLLSLWSADRGFIQESLPLLRDLLSEDQRQQLVRMTADLETHGDIALADALRSAPQPDQPSPGRNLNPPTQVSKNAETFYVSGQYRKCDDSLRSRLSVLPDTSLSILLPCAFYTGDYRTASLAARRLKSTPATRASGLYWETRADQKLAVAAFARASETGANNPQLHALLGDIYRQKQLWSESENEYRKALALDPHSPGSNLGLAMALFADGKSDEALSIDRALLVETPDNPEENLLAGEILVRSGHNTEAETYLKKVPATEQKLMPRVHILLGEIYFAADRLPEALSELKSSQLSDGDGSIHYQLGRIYRKLGDKDKADEAFTISRQLREQADNQADISPQ